MKKILSISFALLLAVNCCTYSFAVKAESLIPGDINGDGAVNARDKICVTEVIKGTNLPEYYTGECDINGDGKYNAKDKGAISSIIKGRDFEDIVLYYSHFTAEDFQRFICEPETFANTDEEVLVVENGTLYLTEYRNGEKIKVETDGFGFYPYYDLFNVKSVSKFGSKSVVSKYLRSEGLIGEGLVDEIMWFDAPFVKASLYVTMGDKAFVIKGALDPYSEAYPFEEYYALYCEIDDVTIDAMGNKVKSDLAKIYGESADVPFCATMEALGAELEWQDETTLNFTWNGNSYTFEITTHNVYKNGEWFMEFAALPGGNMYYKPLEYEVVMDYVTLWTFLDMEGYRVSFDRNDATVYITES